LPRVVFISVFFSAAKANKIHYEFLIILQRQPSKKSQKLPQKSLHFFRVPPPFWKMSSRTFDNDEFPVGQQPSEGRPRKKML